MLKGGAKGGQKLDFLIVYKYTKCMKNGFFDKKSRLNW